MARRAWLFVCLLLAVSELRGQNLPAPPSKSVDTTYPTQAGSTLNVPSGGDFQAALNSAMLGDTIVLQAGATFTGNFTLPAKSGTGWIIIRTSAADSSLPAQGHRMTPSYAASLPKIVTPNANAAIQSAPGAHNYRFVAVEVSVNAGVSNYGLVVLDDGNTSTLSSLPSNIIFDRVWLHGQPNDNLRRGIAMNSVSTAVIDSTISDVHESGADNQTIACWNGPGPFKITNNDLEAAGENVLFGGADPKVTNLVPSDIEIRGNYFFKPAAWRTASWTVKNILELKNAQRVLVDGNVFEHNWPQAQNGYSILFTVRNQAGTAPWSVVQDITFTHNIVRHVAGAINMQGTDNLQPSQQTYRVLISNNVFDDVSDTNWGGNGNLQQVISNPLDVTVDHNTAFPTYADLIGGGTPTQRFIYRNNLEAAGRFGVAGDYHYGDPAGALSTYFPGATFVKNALIGATCSQYPANNFCPATTTDVGFTNFAGGDYHLASTSPYKNAGTDGKDLGADIDSVNAATAGAVSGNSTAPPPPPPPPPPADTTPPSVSITAPANGATVSATISVNADASDNVGVVGVQFYVDSATLGAEDTTAPYSVSWDTTTASNGAHVLTAVARDAAGNKTTSAAVNVTVSNAPATQSPYFGTPFSIPGSFEAENFDKGGEGLAYHDNTPGNQGGQYRTTEDVDIISPYAGGYVVNNFENGEWLEYSINVTTTGTYKLEALVSSAMTGSQFHVSIDGVDKTGIVSVPNTGAWTTFQWVAKDGVSLTAGQHILRVTADVQYFNFDAMRLSQNADTTPPTVSITSPASGATVSGKVTISANASDDVGVVGVQFYVGSTPVGAEDLTAPYSVSWDTTTVVNGAHSLTAVARDAAGNKTTSAVVSVTVSNNVPDTTPPTVSITYPSSGTTMFGTITVTATASDNVGVAGVQFYVDNAPLGTEDLTAPYSTPWDTTRFTNGSHTLTAIARDAAGNRNSSAAVTVTVSNGAARGPYNGTPAAIPGQFEAEDFDKGGEGVAYHDNTPGNQGGLYRTTEDVDIISPYSGGYVINNFESGEWLEYTVNVTTAGTYKAEALVSSAMNNSQFHVSVDGVDKTGPVVVPNTGAWTTFQWVGNGGISLTAGQHIVRMTADLQYFNFDRMRFSLNNTPRAPFNGTPAAVPGQFEAEDFDKGGEGVAYHDNTPGNQGGQYRTAEDVDITSPYSGGYVVNNFENGEWLEYTINVTIAGSYRIEALVSSALSNSQFHISIDGTDKTGPVIAPNTGAWSTFQWVGVGGINLTAGQHILRMSTDLQYFNFDRMRLTQETPATPPLSLSASITSPAAGATVSGTIHVSGTANISVAGITFFVDANPIGPEATVAPYGVSWNTLTVANGSHSLTAIARDAAGNTAVSPAVQIVVSNGSNADTTPPTVTITSPNSGASVSGTLQVAATASDNVGVAGVQFYLDGTPLGTEAVTAPYSVSWNTAAATNGTHSLTAVARDASGNRTTSAAIQVTVSNGTSAHGLTVTLTSPANGATVSGKVQVSASAWAGVVGVRFYVDGNLIGMEDNFAPFSVSWDTTTTSDGSHNLTAVARDLSGNIATSAPVSVTVRNAGSRKRPAR